MVKIRPTVREDRDAIITILKDTSHFTDEEVSVADELLNSYFDQSFESGYWTYTAGEEKVAGYICYGPTPMTDGTYDIYWIAVDPEKQGQHVGSSLLKFAEDDIAKRNGRLITIYTSSQERYGSTRNFYLNQGYLEGARIRNYYRRGDDLVIYVKLISED